MIVKAIKMWESMWKIGKKIIKPTQLQGLEYNNKKNELNFVVLTVFFFVINKQGGHTTSLPKVRIPSWEKLSSWVWLVKGSSLAEGFIQLRGLDFYSYRNAEFRRISLRK